MKGRSPNRQKATGCGDGVGEGGVGSEETGTGDSACSSIGRSMCYQRKQIPHAGLSPVEEG